MAITAILAMTAEEQRTASSTPQRFAILGCHFSSTKQGLTGVPDTLSNGCGLVIDDRFIPEHIDIQSVLQQLRTLSPPYIILDFQRPLAECMLDLAKELMALSCPIAMPPIYGNNLDCPIFLPPIPPHIPPHEYLSPWKNREVWLELALDATEITITEQGSLFRSFHHAEAAENTHTDSMLHCHYKISQNRHSLKFYCYRTKEDIGSLLRSPLPENVTCTIGLFQELGG